MHQQVAKATNTRGKGRGSTPGVPRALPLLQVLIQQPPQGAHTFRIYKKTGQEQASMGDRMENPGEAEGRSDCTERICGRQGPRPPLTKGCFRWSLGMWGQGRVGRRGH